MSIEILGFTKTETDPFLNLYDTNYYTGLIPQIGSGPGSYYYNTENLYVFQQVGDIEQAFGTITIPYSATVKYYLVGGGGAGDPAPPVGAGTGAGGAGGEYISGTFTLEKGMVLNLLIGGGGNPILPLDGGDTSLTINSLQINSASGGLTGLSGSLSGDNFIDILDNVYFYGGDGGNIVISYSEGGFGYNGKGGNGGLATAPPDLAGASGGRAGLGRALHGSGLRLTSRGGRPARARGRR